MDFFVDLFLPTFLRPALLTFFFTSSQGSEGLLSVYWDNVFVGSIDERFVLDGIQEYTFPLPAIYHPGLYSLGFRVDPFTEITSDILIDNVRLGFSMIPEPTGLTALLLLMGMLRHRLKTKRRLIYDRPSSSG